jgi:L-aspartate oxidase
MKRSPRSLTSTAPSPRSASVASGAVIADPEFVQFHPTAIAVGRDPAPLATEALRGEGAVLVNDRRALPADWW